MSGLALTCVVAAYTPTAHVDERMRGVLPAPPTTMRDFRNDDALVVFAGHLRRRCRCREERDHDDNRAPARRAGRDEAERDANAP